MNDLIVTRIFYCKTQTPDPGTDFQYSRRHAILYVTGSLTAKSPKQVQTTTTAT